SEEAAPESAVEEAPATPTRRRRKATAAAESGGLGYSGQTALSFEPTSEEPAAAAPVKRARRTRTRATAASDAVLAESDPAVPLGTAAEDDAGTEVRTDVSEPVVSGRSRRRRSTESPAAISGAEPGLTAEADAAADAETAGEQPTTRRSRRSAPAIGAVLFMPPSEQTVEPPVERPAAASPEVLEDESGRTVALFLSGPGTTEETVAEETVAEDEPAAEADVDEGDDDEFDAAGRRRRRRG